MSPLDIHINDGFLPMVDGSRVYHRGFGDRRTLVNDPKPSLTVSPRVFLRNGSLVASRTYPLKAAVPPLGRPAPAAKDPANPGEFLVRRAFWASFFPDRTPDRRNRQHHQHPRHQPPGPDARPAVPQRGSGEQPRRHRRDQARPNQNPGIPGPQGGHLPLLRSRADPANPTIDPVQRVLGLFRALLVTDPASPWLPMPNGPEFERQWLWMLHNVDPVWAGIASRNGTVDPNKTPVYPRYFTLNGRSGFQSLAASTDKALNRVREEDSLMSGSARQIDVRNFSLSAAAGTVRTGQLMRFLNAGVVHHQLHFHGNHSWTVSATGALPPYGRQGRRRGSRGAPAVGGRRRNASAGPQRLDAAVAAAAGSRRPGVERPEEGLALPDALPCGAVAGGAGRMYPGGLVGHWTLAAPGPGTTRRRTNCSAARWISARSRYTREAPQPSFP